MSEPTVYSIEENGALRDMLIHPKIDGPCNYGLNMYVINRPLLIELIEDCVSRNMYNFNRDFIPVSYTHLMSFTVFYKNAITMH